MLNRNVVRHLLVALSLTFLGNARSQPRVKDMIIDADLFAAVDDTAALLLACTLPNANLLAVNINVNSTYSALAASAIANRYGHPSLPIGLPRPWTNITAPGQWGGEYASKVALGWSGGSVPWFEVNKTWDPVELYRKTLAEAEDRSVTIVSIGHFGSLSGLLNSSADTYSPLDGYGLVKAKVEELVVMGGGYPSFEEEFNFAAQNASQTAHVVNTWPDCVPATFLGAEVGQDVFTGARLTVSGPADDPVKASYQWFGGYNVTQASWDHMTVLYAAGGLGDWFEYGNAKGHNFVFPNGSNVWVEDHIKRNQHYLRLKASNETVAAKLDDLLLGGAWKYAKANSSLSKR